MRKQSIKKKERKKQKEKLFWRTRVTQFIGNVFFSTSSRSFTKVVCLERPTFNWLAVTKVTCTPHRGVSLTKPRNSEIRSVTVLLTCTLANQQRISFVQVGNFHIHIYIVIEPRSEIINLQVNITS